MSNLSSLPPSQLRKALERAKGVAKRAREEGEHIAGRAIQSGLTVGAGYGTGLLRAKFGEGPLRELKIPKTQVDADLAAGLALTFAGTVGLTGKYSEETCALGAGVLAAHGALLMLKTAT